MWLPICASLCHSERVVFAAAAAAASVLLPAAKTNQLSAQVSRLDILIENSRTYSLIPADVYDRTHEECTTIRLSRGRVRRPTLRRWIIRMIMCALFARQLAGTDRRATGRIIVGQELAAGITACNWSRACLPLRSSPLNWAPASQQARKGRCGLPIYSQFTIREPRVVSFQFG